MSPQGAHARQAPARREGAVERPRLKVVGNADAGAQRARRRARLGIGAVLVAVLAIAAFHALLVQSQFVLESREEGARKEQERFERLRLEVAELGAPARIAEEAARLGMVVPGSPVHLRAALPEEQSFTGDQGDQGDRGELRKGGEEVAGIAESWSEVKRHLASGP